MEFKTTIDYKISTMTASTSYGKNMEINLSNVGKYLEIDQFILGIKYASSSSVIVRGAIKETRGNDAKLFYNQVSLVVRLNDNITNVKLFGNGTLHITGIKHEDEPKAIMKLIMEKLNGLKIKTDKILLVRDTNGVYLDSNNMVYSESDPKKIIGYKTDHNYIINKKMYSIDSFTKCFISDKMEAKRTRSILDLNGNRIGYTKIELMKNKLKLYKKNSNIQFDCENVIVENPNIQFEKEIIEKPNIQFEKEIIEKPNIQFEKEIIEKPNIQFEKEIIEKPNIKFEKEIIEKPNIQFEKEIIEKPNIQFSSAVGKDNVVQENPYYLVYFDNTRSTVIGKVVYYLDLFDFKLMKKGSSVIEYTYSCDPFNGNTNSSFNEIVDINCMNIFFDLNMQINRQRLYDQLVQCGYICEYKPEKYSGVKFIYKMSPNKYQHSEDGRCACTSKCVCNNITFLMFQSGNVIVTGCKSRAEIEYVLSRFEEIIRSIKQAIQKRLLI